MNIFVRIKERIEREIREKRLAYYQRKALLPFDKSWFEGKRVAIVGGGDSVLKEPLGTYIDGFDVVVRVNKGVEVIDEQKEYVGTRTDVLFHSFYEVESDKGKSLVTMELWQKYSVRRILFYHNAYNKFFGWQLAEFLLRDKGNNKIYHIGKDLDERNMKTIAPFQPTTGLIAINTILNSLPSEIYITGFTFFKTPHNAKYREGSLVYWRELLNSDQSSHNPEAEYQYFKKIYKANTDKFVLDKTLKAIIEQDGE